VRLSDITPSTSIKKTIKESFIKTNKDNINTLIESLSIVFEDVLSEEYCQSSLLALVEHKRRNISLYESIFRHGSEAHLYSINLARRLFEANLVTFEGTDLELLESDLGKFGVYEGKQVPLDLPMVLEAEYRGKKVELNKPKRGGSKAYHVYVKDPKTGNIKKVNFGSGMRAKINDPEARKAYNARHGCSKGKHNDKTKAGYWSCRLPRFAKSLNLSGGGTWW
jgi:hypothetical protein